MFILRPGILSDLTKASGLGYLGIFELFQCGFWHCYAFLCGVIFSHSRQWPHLAHFERGRLPNQGMFFTKSGRLTPMCKKTKGKMKHAINQKQNKKHRHGQKQMECCFFRHIYKPNICGFSVILATMGDSSDNIFLRAAFGGATEIPVTTTSSSPSTSASGAATFSDAPQSSTRKAKGRAKLQPRRRTAAQVIQNWRTTLY